MKHLCTDGESIVLRRFHSLQERVHDRKGVSAVCLDTETTGLDLGADSLIEIGIRPFEFDPESGELLSIGPACSALQDPKRPLPSEVVALTGIRDQDLAGRSVDWEIVRALLDQASLIIAHNASFDRTFVERHIGADNQHVWACTLSQIDWGSVPSRSQEILCAWQGFFCLEAHRALADADSLLHLLDLSHRLPELHRHASSPAFVLYAMGVPFYKKDLLKARGYRWDFNHRCWKSEFEQEDEVNEERCWAEKAVYGGNFKGLIAHVQPWERFRAER